MMGLIQPDKLREMIPTLEENISYLNPF